MVGDRIELLARHVIRGMIVGFHNFFENLAYCGRNKKQITNLRLFPPRADRPRR
jgi:predicted membrane GTPase involved in stress response